MRLLAPVIPRSKVIGIGKNYADHAKEMGGEAPDEPLMFLKPNTAVVGPGDPIVLPPAVAARSPTRASSPSSSADSAKDVAAERRRRGASSATPAPTTSRRATCSARDGQWARAKGFDTFCPLGPWIETDLDPADLRDHHDARRRGEAGRPRPPTWCTASPTLDRARLGGVHAAARRRHPHRHAGRRRPRRVGQRVEVEIEGIGCCNPFVRH